MHIPKQFRSGGLRGITIIFRVKKKKKTPQSQKHTINTQTGVFTDSFLPQRLARVFFIHTSTGLGGWGEAMR